MIKAPTNFDIPESLATIWQALEQWRAACVPEGTPGNDSNWESVCLAMAWVQEELGIPEQVDESPPALQPRDVFKLTWERVTQESAGQGDAESRGYIRHDGLRILLAHYMGDKGATPDSFALRAALSVLEVCADYSTSGGLYCVEGSDSEPRAARWVTWCYTPDRESGDVFNFSLHFPESATPSSRARLTHLLTK